MRECSSTLFMITRSTSPLQNLVGPPCVLAPLTGGVLMCGKEFVNDDDDVASSCEDTLLSSNNNTFIINSEGWFSCTQSKIVSVLVKRH